ncbi:MAG: TetR/AcrR family transcriptional regulator [Pigmentiphaga sp.]|uniref:TetR/AcrR family transcriptional regulator n=1 Tax=Pigmentiphaga sp. TaxID=1977564 RepID=UPI0029A0ACCA|nr:TetR/AcrR family transcriptional regulator [Pigmentiphaga sp.]MDX3907162.1 TetR/AcrR family transcriptional regulator [Pigmentiphaga sp.]
MDNSKLAPHVTPQVVTRLLDVAELLFAEHGFTAASVRQIAQSAGVNQALINYHFKTKQGLFMAVFERRCRVLMQERQELLAQAMRRGAEQGKVELRDIIYAFVYPPLRMANDDGPGGRAFVKLQARLHHEPKELEQTLRAHYYDETTFKFVDALRACFPDRPPESIYWRLTFVMGIYIYVASNTGRIEIISRGQCKGTDLSQALAEILDFCEHGF